MKYAWKVGMRVAFGPHTDLFMQGCRYGTIERIGRKWVYVRVDRTGRLARCAESSISVVD